MLDGVVRRSRQKKLKNRGNTMNRDINDIRAFWNKQAGLGLWAGTRDVVAKQIEIEAFARHIKDGQNVLDIGCGNGITALEMAKRFRITMTGFDYAEQMVNEAKALAEKIELTGTATFRVGDVTSMNEELGQYDVVYTERVIINLADWPTQAKAITSITKLLKPGGRFLMCENSQDGLDRLNAVRATVELPPIVAPWHNRYLRDQEVESLGIEGVELESVEDYSSTYYFLSRVVNAALAQQSGKEPEYESPINLLSTKLPSFGKLGQGRLWIWRRNR
jgi:ubiquinone/menaquinone biosynthesis C-methylase UbiE